MPGGCRTRSSVGDHRRAGNRLQQVEQEQREGEGLHSSDQMTSLLQLMFSGVQTHKTEVLPRTTELLYYKLLWC